uniref:ORF43 n=1 Tax=Cydia pomonella granulosis virus TaxID=28289 RepID=A0A097P0Z3_GVCP|nr:ORF43 [Cydia pomonella granulovirus]
MIHYHTTRFYYTPANTTTHLTHCIRVYKNVAGDYTIVRGDIEQVERLSGQYTGELVCCIDNVHCVWDYGCTTKHQIQVIEIRVYKEELVEELVTREQNRVINFENDYVHMFVDDN